jgi:indolepyruvate ferredoxin oxidoreductase, beta subunit
MKIKYDPTKLTPINFILVGVGGQGTILASDILAEAGLKLGYDVKKAEVHGMSQRGGSVISNLRWAPQVFSPIVSLGDADVLVAFEKLEAARFRTYLRPGGMALINQYSIPPVTVSAGTSTYPEDDQITESLISMGAEVYWVEGLRLAEEIGNLKTANVVIIGALSAVLDLPVEIVLDVVKARVPAKFQDLNKTAFEAGYHSM